MPNELATDGNVNGCLLLVSCDHPDLQSVGTASEHYRQHAICACTGDSHAGDGSVDDCAFIHFLWSTVPAKCGHNAREHHRHHGRDTKTKALPSCQRLGEIG